MLKVKIYICERCGRPFIKAAGGIILSPKQVELEIHPVCDLCRLEKLRDIFR